MGVIKIFKVGQKFTYSDGRDYIINNINEKSLTKDEISLIELGIIDERKYYDKIMVICGCLDKTYVGLFTDLETLYKGIKEMHMQYITCTDKDVRYSSIPYGYFTGTGKINAGSSAKCGRKIDPNTIVDYKVINNTVVIFTFADGTTEKTVCNHEFDEFELWRAVELAICKKKFGGTKAYHNAVNNAIKQIENIDAKKNAEEEEKERIANRKAKYQQRKAKRMAKKRQEQIDIQTEAFYKAMLMYDETQLSKDVESSDEDVTVNTPVETDETK